ncbi:hypothetical protein A3Q56_00957 [Intoshia linei]|uniref:Uncharacterized protein n=1 Tax=Intoshia linei TaxID=1819745 RepID=A0A177BC90_9BILA|nr:hypothetical protein A3Q56_00957 [Intoshia linei]
MIDSKDVVNDGYENTPSFSKKEILKNEKNLVLWKEYIQFLFRHTAICTLKYNNIENYEICNILKCLEKLTDLLILNKPKKKKKKKSGKKKGKTSSNSSRSASAKKIYLNSMKKIYDSLHLFIQCHNIAEFQILKNFVDVASRIRSLILISRPFIKSLCRNSVQDQNIILKVLDYAKGFSLRNYDYTNILYQDSFEESDFFIKIAKKFTDGTNDKYDPKDVKSFVIKFMPLYKIRQYAAWIVAIRTSLSFFTKFLKMVTLSLKIPLLPLCHLENNLKCMTVQDFVVARNIHNMMNKTCNYFHDSNSANQYLAEINNSSTENAYKSDLIEQHLPDDNDVAIENLTSQILDSIKLENLQIFDPISKDLFIIPNEPLIETKTKRSKKSKSKQTKPKKKKRK